MKEYKLRVTGIITIKATSPESALDKLNDMYGKTKSVVILCVDEKDRKYNNDMVHKMNNTSVPLDEIDEFEKFFGKY
jgi:hypothetical protein